MSPEDEQTFNSLLDLNNDHLMTADDYAGPAHVYRVERSQSPPMLDFELDRSSEVVNGDLPAYLSANPPVGDPVSEYGGMDQPFARGMAQPPPPQIDPRLHAFTPRPCSRPRPRSRPRPPLPHPPPSSQDCSRCRRPRRRRQAQTPGPDKEPPSGSEGAQAVVRGRHRRRGQDSIVLTDLRALSTLPASRRRLGKTAGPGMGVAASG